MGSNFTRSDCEPTVPTAVIQYRHFRNCDPPGIVELWRSQPPLDGRVQPLSTAMLEHYVLSKPYFDPQGLIVAVDGQRIIGLAHAGFGVDDDHRQLSNEMGVISMLLVDPHLDNQSEIATQLLERAETYLREGGAKLLYAGGIYPVNPFYLGLYGGSELPGVLSGDTRMLQMLTNNGYAPIDHVTLLERDLTTFRPKVDRKVLQVRRKYHIEATFDPPARHWWDSCLFGLSERTRFVLRAPSDEAIGCRVTFWDMEPLASSWGVQAVGMVELITAENLRRQGLATFLVGEALRQLHAYGISRCQVQAMESNSAALGLYNKLGFEAIEQGVVLRKDASSS